MKKILIIVSIIGLFVFVSKFKSPVHGKYFLIQHNKEIFSDTLYILPDGLYFRKFLDKHGNSNYTGGKYSYLTSGYYGYDEITFYDFDLPDVNILGFRKFKSEKFYIKRYFTATWLHYGPIPEGDEFIYKKI